MRLNQTHALCIAESIRHACSVWAEFLSNTKIEREFLCKAAEVEISETCIQFVSLCGLFQGCLLWGWIRRTPVVLPKASVMRAAYGLNFYRRQKLKGNLYAKQQTLRSQKLAYSCDILYACVRAWRHIIRRKIAAPNYKYMSLVIIQLRTSFVWFCFSRCDRRCLLDGHWPDVIMKAFKPY